MNQQLSYQLAFNVFLEKYAFLAMTIYTIANNIIANKIVNAIIGNNYINKNLLHYEL